MTRDEIEKIIASGSSPTGVMAQDDNGKLYFLDENQQRSLELRPSAEEIKLRKEVLQKIGSKPSPRPEVSFCDGLEGWLTTHSIHTKGWGSIARWYLDEC